MTKLRRRVLQAGAVGVVIAIGAGTLLFFGRADETLLPEPPKPVRIAIPATATLEETLESWGNARSANQVTVLSRVAGTVTAVNADQGDPVEEGDIIAVIDRDAYALEVEQAEAIRAASASTWERIDRLYAAGNATRQDWENARASHLAAEAQASAARLRYGWTEVKAPTSGVVLVRHVNAGSLVAPDSATPLYTLGSLENLELEVHLPESMYPAFAAIDRPRVRIESEALPFARLHGEIRTVAPWVDPITRSFSVVCAVQDDDGWLRPGMLLSARFVVRTHAGVMALPVEAMSGEGRFWAVDGNGRARIKEFSDAVVSGDSVIVPDDWKDTPFIVEGQHFLQDGDAVRVTDR